MDGKYLHTCLPRPVRRDAAGKEIFSVLSERPNVEKAVMKKLMMIMKK